MGTRESAGEAESAWGRGERKVVAGDEGLKDLPRRGGETCALRWWGMRLGRTPCLLSVPFLEFLFGLWGAGALPGRGACLPHFSAAPNRALGKAGPCQWAGGGRDFTMIASVFLFALFLFCNSGPVLNTLTLLALKLQRFHCDKHTNCTVRR